MCAAFFVIARTGSGDDRGRMLFSLVARLASKASSAEGEVPPSGEFERQDDDEQLLAEGAAALEQADAERLQAIVRQHFQFVFRTLRRMLPADAVDDAVQQTFVVASRKVKKIEPGKERAFLAKTALWVAAFVRRTRARRRETLDADAMDRRAAAGPSPEDAALESDRRRQLEAVLEAMPAELRTVFVLFELEGMSSHEIAPIVDAPVGTVASRLRRAREAFHVEAQRLRARTAFRGGAS
jgi:RNA polymerase sigma-70 factor (ECF subfamily)